MFYEHGGCELPVRPAGMAQLWWVSPVGSVLLWCLSVAQIGLLL